MEIFTCVLCSNIWLRRCTEPELKLTVKSWNNQHLFSVILLLIISSEPCDSLDVMGWDINTEMSEGHLGDLLSSFCDIFFLFIHCIKVFWKAGICTT